MSIKSFKAFVTEKTDYAAGVQQGNPEHHKGGKKHAGGEAGVVKQGASKIAENVAADFKAPADSDEEATEYKPRSKGEEKFKAAHKIQSTKHPVAGDHQFDGSRNEVRS